MTYLIKIVIRLAMCVVFLSTWLGVKGQDTQEELDHYLDSLTFALNDMPDELQKLVILNEISLIHYNVDSTYKYASMELDLAKRLQVGKYEARAYSYLGWYFLQIDEYEKTCTCYQNAILVIDSVSDVFLLSQCYYGLGTAKSVLGDDISADECFMKSLRLFESVGQKKKVSELYRKLALLRMDYHLYQVSKECIDKAFDIDIQRGDTSSLGDDHFALGMLYYRQYIDMNNPDFLFSARTEILKGYDLVKGLGNLYSIYWKTSELMTIYHEIAMIQSGDERILSMDSSRYFYNVTDSLYRLCSMGSQNIYIDLWEAEDLALQGKITQSLQILNSIESHKNLSLQNKLYLYRAMTFVYESTNDYVNALKYVKLLNKEDRETYSRDFAVRVTSGQYERELSRQEQLQQKQKYTLLILKLCLGMALLILLVFLCSLLRKRKLNRQLTLRNNEIAFKNANLNESNAEILAQREEIEAQRVSLEETSQMLQSSINYAKHIQDAAVTSREAMSRMFGDTLVVWKPLNVVSGDFYWAMQHGNLKFVVLADCTGHGVPGAFMSMFAISSLNSIVSPLSFTNIKASEVLDMLRAKIISELHQAKASGDSIDSVDMTFCIIDTDKMLMQYAGANRPLLIVRDGNAIVYKPDKMPVGLHKRNDPFTNHVIDLKKDDVLYMYTDGITDQFGYEDGQDSGVKFSVKRLESLLLSIADKPFAAQGQILDMAITGWRVTPDNAVIEQYDDQLLLGIRIS